MFFGRISFPALVGLLMNAVIVGTLVSGNDINSAGVGVTPCAVTYKTQKRLAIECRVHCQIAS